MKKSSLTYRYFTLFVIALVAVSLLIGVFMLNHSIRQLYQAQEEAVMYGIEQVVEACQRDYQTMNEVALDMMVDYTYNPRHLRQSKYNELPLLTALSRQVYRTNGVSNYFLMYRDQPGWIFAGNGGAYALPVYLRDVLKVDENQEMSGLLCGLNRFTVLIPEGGSGSILMCYPLYFLNDYDKNAQAVMVFAVNRTRYENIYASYMNRFDTRYLLSCAGLPVAGSTGGQEEKESLSVTSSNGLFSLSVRYDPAGQVNFMRYVSEMNAVYPVTLILVILLIGGGMAYANVKPLRDLIRRFERNGGDGCANELLHLENILQDEVKKSDLSMYRLKQQMLLQILEGKRTGQNDEMHRFLQISLEQPYLTAYLIVSETVSVEEREFVSMVEEFSDEDMRLYCVRQHRPDAYAVIAGMNNKNRQSEIYDLLESLVDRRDARIYAGKTVECAALLGEVYTELATAYTRAEQEDEPDARGGMTVQAFAGGNKRRLDALEEALESGNERCALENLAQCIAEMRGRVPSLLMQRYLGYEVLGRILDFANRREIALDDRDVLKSMNINDLEGFYADLARLIGTVCLKTAGEIPVKPDLAAGIMRYIDQNFSNPDLSLDAIAEVFGISANYAGMVVKGYTGIPYKSYLTDLRIHEARRLLIAEFLSVSETAERVGYRRTSNFIKKFKEMTGYTPLKYREEDGQDKPAQRA